MKYWILEMPSVCKPKDCWVLGDNKRCELCTIKPMENAKEVDLVGQRVSKDEKSVSVFLLEGR